MSLDIFFNKTVSIKEIKEKTNLKIIEKKGRTFLEDDYGNSISYYEEGMTLYYPQNPNRILDELIKIFDIEYIDDDAFCNYIYEPEKYKDIDLYIPTMLKYGYFLGVNGKIVIPKRTEKDYLPYKNEENNDVTIKTNGNTGNASCNNTPLNDDELPF